MRKKFNNIYQFKITLKFIKPPIWRRIQVPETYTFWDLHVAIQDAMGWTDSHLHEFEIKYPLTGEKVYIGTPHEDWDFYGRIVIPENEQKICDWFTKENRVAEYIYDFGDNWRHEVKFEKVLPRDSNIKYPVCIGGKRACPPEDCGGVWRYMEFLKAIKNPNHERHKELLEWIGGKFDPEYFAPNEVIFDDPTERWKSRLY